MAKFEYDDVVKIKCRATSAERCGEQAWVVIRPLKMRVDKLTFAPPDAQDCPGPIADLPVPP